MSARAVVVHLRGNKNIKFEDYVQTSGEYEFPYRHVFSVQDGALLIFRRSTRQNTETMLRAYAPGEWVEASVQE